MKNMYNLLIILKMQNKMPFLLSKSKKHENSEVEGDVENRQTLSGMSIDVDSLKGDVFIRSLEVHNLWSSSSTSGNLAGGNN